MPMGKRPVAKKATAKKPSTVSRTTSGLTALSAGLDKELAKKGIKKGTRAYGLARAKQNAGLVGVAMKKAAANRGRSGSGSGTVPRKAAPKSSSYKGR